MTTREMERLYYTETNGKRIRSNKAVRNKKKLSGDTFISKKELKKKAEVNTVNLNKPMTYAELKKLDDGMLAIYINHLRETFGVSNIQLAEMLGAPSNGVVGAYCRSHGVPQVGSGPVKTQTAEQRKAWDKFCDGEYESPEKIEKENSISEPEIIKPEPDAVITVKNTTDIISNQISEIPVGITFSDITCDLTKEDLKVIMDMLNCSMQSGKRYHLTINICEQE